MRLSCTQENLNRGLSLVGRASARTTLPITNNILLTAEDGRLKLSATNLEMAVSCWIGAKVEEEGEITVNARLLADFVGSLPNDKIEISLSPRSKSLKIKCARFEARISGVDAKDFPPIPKVGDGIQTSVEIDAFCQAISQVAFAAATDESRPVLTGVSAEFDADKLTLAAADGFRLAVYTLPLAKPVKQKAQAIIPARSLSELGRLCQDQTEPISITLDASKGQILFALKSVELVSQLIQGNFPQYSQLIPQEFTTKATIEAAQFQMASKTAAIFSRDGGGIVRLVMTPGGEKKPGRITISARSEEVGDDTGEIDAAISGEEAKIAFNGKYLTDVLNAIPEKQVSLELTTPSSPGVIRPMGSDNYTHVVMPMFVQW